MSDKKVIMIAGPNGAGKTTFAHTLLGADGRENFINADIIAAELSPAAPEAASFPAGRMMLERLDACVLRNESFALETTLAGLSYLNRIRAWQSEGYQVSLYFLSLPNVEMAIARVAERVAQGGHHVPAKVIRHRFSAGRQNFDRVYRQAVNLWILIDNSGDAPTLLDRGTNP